MMHACPLCGGRVLVSGVHGRWGRMRRVEAHYRCTRCGYGAHHFAEEGEKLQAGIAKGRASYRRFTKWAKTYNKDRQQSIRTPWFPMEYWHRTKSRITSIEPVICGKRLVWVRRDGPTVGYGHQKNMPLYPMIGKPFRYPTFYAARGKTLSQHNALLFTSQIRPKFRLLASAHASPVAPI
jgi:DNA-directed RNA polymerase subunit RPC12/RpoP